MPGVNGTSKRRVYHAVPRTETFPIKVMRDGKPVVLDFVGHHSERPEVWVQIEMAAAHERYEAEIMVDNVSGERVGDEVPDKIFRRNDAAFAIYRRDMLVACLKEKESGEALRTADADVLVADGGGWLEILSELGWWVTAPVEGVPSDPEGGGGAAGPTGSASSPDSAPATAATTGST